MWEYKVVGSTYEIEGAQVKVRVPAGEQLLAQILDHYGAEGWELVTLHMDVTQAVVMVLKRPRALAVAPRQMIGAPATPPLPVPMPPLQAFDAPLPRFPVSPSPVAPSPRPPAAAAPPEAAPPPAPGGPRKRRSAAELRKLAGE